MTESDPQSTWRPDRPYDALPLLPPRTEVESRRVLKQCIDARAALAELKQAIRLIPNPSMLINTLPVLEARASSEIENIVTTADKLFEHVRVGTDADPATKEALRYRHALLEGFDSLETRPLSSNSAEAICSRIKDVDVRVRRVPGVSLANQRTGEVIYTPPESPVALRDLLRNWELFLHGEDDLDPLVKLAIAHYQFEAIHPFTDGNGRTGRILNILYLVETELLPLPILYLSRHIIENRSEYYQRLLQVTSHGAWEPWLLYMLRGIEETSRWTVAKIAAIRELSDRTAEFVRTSFPKFYARELTDTLFEQPYCRIANLVEAGIAKRQAASTYLTRLAEAGVLEVRNSGREKLFMNTRLLALLQTDDNELPSI